MKATILNVAMNHCKNMLASICFISKTISDFNSIKLIDPVFLSHI